MKEYIAPLSFVAAVYALYKIFTGYGSSARIASDLGMLHQLLQLHPDDHTVAWEDGTTGTLAEAIDYYVNHLIEELRS